MFKSKLNMQHIDATVKYKLITRLVYESWDKITYIVPKNYPSDGHSIPVLLRSIAGSPFATKYPKSAWLHDRLCETGEVPRSKADSMYSQAMADEKAPVWKRKRNWLGVRIGAGFKWLGGLFKRKKEEVI